MGFLWEVGSSWVYLCWIAVFLLQILVAEINRRWVWTAFALWTAGGILVTPYVIAHGVPMVGWFPFGKFVIMVATATMTAFLLAWGKRNPMKAHRYAFWLGVALWIGLAVNITEANIRDITIFFEAKDYQACAASAQCLKEIDAARSVSMIAGLPETRAVAAPVLSDEWYDAVAHNFAAKGIGIDPATGFRTMGGYWNLLTAAAGFLNIITITGLGKIFITSPGKAKVRGLIWVDMAWPWIIAYDLWNHAFLYNALADYTWYCTLALLLACTVPAFTWAKGQWIWFRCFTLMFWIAANNIFPQLLVQPSAMTNYATMNPMANIVCAWAAFLFNVWLFVYWLMKMKKFQRNPLTNCLFFELGAFKRVVKEHADDRDKYFLTDMVKQTPLELGFEPDSHVPPREGYVGWMPWWKEDKRYPKLRTPLAADPKLIEKGVLADPRWDVTLSHESREK
ncbi:hypothetical protein JOD55_000260 [Arcanobacterium pluranimalium]|uniref:DUF5692 family protein n=1 Tax=Arcanobacterium pluranimalium TaxID=108028 RepID=UPI00195989A1|nr:DUF5692 family protein [Arcanobacterium pluranimalium]MBM7824433.1 hypothetical protein [Arcanobacterium pluranimalium]